MCTSEREIFSFFRKKGKSMGAVTGHEEVVLI
jgi:hypothetical protein